MRLNYLFIPAVTIIVAYFGNQFTSLGLGEWYDSLNKPALTPPGIFIGIVWMIIYVLTTISALKVYNINFRNFRWFLVMLLFLINAGLNVYWSYLFFSQHNIAFAFNEMIILEGTVLALIVLTWRYSVLASSLLIPYAVWAGFASYLTYNIIALN